MKVKILKKKEVTKVCDLLERSGLKAYNGESFTTETSWIENLITNEDCYSFALKLDREIIGVILTEKLTFNGCLMWLFAIDPKFQKMGYGSYLLRKFEKILKSKNIKWIYLTSTKNSLDFYSKNGYTTSSLPVPVFEYLKEL